MRITVRNVCAITVLGMMLGSAALAHADDLTVKMAQGKVQGKTINDGKVNAFLGLPYAAPPVGDLRWKAPESAAKWKGVRDASHYGARCMQAPVFADMVFQDSGPSEDCLYLNVFVPAIRKERQQAPRNVLDSRRRLFWRIGLRTAP